jgi:hypothetical protein
MKAIKLIHCSSNFEWFLALSVINRFQAQENYLFIPIVSDYVFKKVNSFAKFWGVETISSDFRKEYSELESCQDKIKRNKEFINRFTSNERVLPFLSQYLAKDFVSSESDVSFPENIKESIEFYRKCNVDYYNKNVVVALGEIASHGATLFSVFFERLMFLAGSISDIRKNLYLFHPNSAVFSIDNNYLTLNKMQSILDTLYGPENNISAGLLYSLDKDTLLWFVIKLKLYQTFVEKVYDRLIWTAFNNDPVIGDQNNRDFREELRKRYDLICLGTHSNGLDTYLGKSALCTFVSEKKSVRDNNFKVLPCFYGAKCIKLKEPGESRPYWQVDNLISEQEISCNTLFLSVCHGVMFNDGVYDQGSSLGHNILCSEKVNCFVTSHRYINSCTEETLLFYFLYNQGIEIGKIVAKLNTFHRDTFGEFPSYFLYGDPLLCAENRIKMMRTHELCNLIEGFCGTEIKIGEINFSTDSDFIVKIVLTDNSKVKETLFPFYTIPNFKGDAKPTLNGVCFQDENSTLWLFVSNYERVKLDNISFLLFKDNPFALYLKLFDNISRSINSFVNLYLKEFEKFDTISSYISEVRKYKEVLTRLLTNYQRLNKLIPNSLLDYDQIKTGADKVLLLLREFQHRVLTLNVKYAGQIAGSLICKIWMHFFKEEAQEKKVGRCKYCNSLLLRKTYVNLYDDSLVRNVGNCLGCGVISDISSMLDLQCIEGSRDLIKGDQTTQSVLIANLSGVTLFLAAILQLEDFNKQNSSLSDEMNLILNPNEKIQLNFSLNVPTTFKNGKYDMSCIILANADINVLRKNVYIVDKS